MTTFSSMPLHIRGFLLIWLLLLLYVGFLVLFRYIQRHRWWVRYIPLLALMLGEYFLYQIILSINSDLTSGDAPGLIFRMFHDVPLVVYTAAMLLMTAVTLSLLRGVQRWQEHHITATSVKEGVDSLPTGLLYFWNDGRIKLVNRRMMEIARRLTGLSLQDGNQFLARLQEGQQEKKEPILTLPDGKVWSFYHREATLESETLNEVIAVDISEEYRLREELAEENRRLASMNQRLHKLNDMIGEITVEKETLATKIRIHDETGRTMLATRRYLEGEETGLTLQELLGMWERIVSLAPAPDDAEHTEDVTGDLYQAAEAIGIRLDLIGEAGTRQEQKLLLAGARECLTNAYRHAQATELTIRIEHTRPGEGFPGGTVISYTNDGLAPVGPVREGGGLSSLRRIVESEGAEMEIEYCPAFCLRILIPEQ
ncbi:MAG: hypothetical protein IJR62_06310 [Lachnospiraceae bacterium]|nr:hypothetical protein [Lachnospiraceae bacterium]